MPTVDPSRATFVTQEYRYETALDNAVKANFPKAEPLVIDTQLSSASAATLATTILNASKTHALVFEIEIDGVIRLEDFDGTVNHYTLDAPMFATDGRTFKLMDVEVDWQANKSKLMVRG